MIVAVLAVAVPAHCPWMLLTVRARSIVRPALSAGCPVPLRGEHDLTRRALLERAIIARATSVLRYTEATGRDMEESEGSQRRRQKIRLYIQRR